MENQTHLMCIGMDPLSIIVHVYNGTAHSPRSHLLCRADFQLWRLLTPWGMTTTCPTTSSGNTNNVSALRTWGRQCRRHPNTQAGSKRGYRRRNPRPNQLYGRQPPSTDTLWKHHLRGWLQVSMNNRVDGSYSTAAILECPERLRKGERGSG